MNTTTFDAAVAVVAACGCGAGVEVATIPNAIRMVTDQARNVRRRFMPPNGSRCDPKGPPEWAYTHPDLQGFTIRGVGTTLSDAIAASAEVRVRSRDASGLLSMLMGLHIDTRRPTLEQIIDTDLPLMTYLGDAAEREMGSRYGMFVDDPIGFTQMVLGESVWSKQGEAITALTTHKRVIVPAGFGVGKTHSAAYAAMWFGCVRPVGTALTVTTATRFRQVQRQLWPHIRRLHAKAGLPGDCDMTQWKMPDLNGVDTVVAYGFSAPEHDEAAMQGIHAGALLLIVDEAGGFSRMLGSSTRNLLTGDARMLAIGNPPSDDESSWFETATEDGMDPERVDTITIRIRAKDSPAITGEDTGDCLSCPSNVPPHPIGTHLVDQAWVDDAIREHGEDAPYVIAKVNADFPKGGSSRAIPSSYVDAGMEAALDDAWWEPEDLPETPFSVDRKGIPYRQQPTLGADIRLGVDVAADGGDEMVIARAEGDIVRIRLVQSGSSNQNATDVAGKILEEIRHAQILAAEIGTETDVRVKVDAIGIGWGVVGILEAWKSEGIHDAVIVRAVVSESPDKPDNPKAQWRPHNKRAEMWLNGRELLQPDATTGRVRMRLDVDGRCAAQLRAPEYGTNASGKQVIESKKSMKDRGVSSPDRAEAVLLAVYEPKVKRKARVLA